MKLHLYSFILFLHTTILWRLYRKKGSKPSFNWNEINSLPVPFQTTRHDIIFSGQGTYRYEGYTCVPGNVECWLLAPDGASISKNLHTALLSGNLISKLAVNNQGEDIFVNNKSKVYRQGEAIPNYILAPVPMHRYNPKALTITVESETKLSELFMYLLPVIEPGKIIRCFWASYTPETCPDHPVVYHW